MQDHDSNTDLSAYGPAEIAQETSILAIEAREIGIDVAGVLASFLAPEQREASRLTDMPATSSSTRWVLEMRQLQAVTALLLQRQTIEQTYSLYITSEMDMRSEERAQARHRASLANWGLRLSSVTTGITIYPIMLSAGAYSLSPPGTPPSGSEMKLDEEEITTIEGLDNEDNEMTEQLDDDSAVLEVVDSSPLVTVQLPPLQDPETFFAFENQHANIVGQQDDMDGEELEDDELEEDIRNMELMLEQEGFAARTGSASLRMMDANLNNLHGLLHGIRSKPLEVNFGVASG
ncbi:hypothetical protein M407DRAFT_33284 [Tulasnella calospora MUT 4182]|uniref:Uncharacterized protein n=1 Tax=Tulasnella calospora MUT 4182 TaxID=1051891 RepID=A0A0C3Q2K9_9AGAM|nr:hypothetical protein M407DRAFT_33284 [Tulasnella calospora MUT 4182]